MNLLIPYVTLFALIDKDVLDKWTTWCYLYPSPFDLPTLILNYHTVTVFRCLYLTRILIVNFLLCIFSYHLI